MRYLSYLILIITISFSVSSFAGNTSFTYKDTDVVNNSQLTAYYDLRERNSYIQITHNGIFTNENVTIHVQIFQHDRNCDELNFFDTLTLNDTVIYDLDNLVRNDGSEVPASIDSNSYGYVVISTSDINGNLGAGDIIGNFRIIDDSGYEYRTNMVGPFDSGGVGSVSANSDTNIGHAINFNTINDAKYADIIGYAYQREDGGTNFDTVTNIDEGYSFDIFVYDMDEEPLSCDRRNFACGATMVYGVNEDYPASKGDPLLCPGGGLADPQGGFVNFVNPNFVGTGVPELPSFLRFIGFIGINNGNGTGSMDGWYGFQDVAF